MISGAHMVIYSTDAESDRAFFRDVLAFPHVDAGQGWLIFALPPSEIAVHPDAQGGRHEVYFLCDDLPTTINELARHGVECTPAINAGWGLLTHFTLPGGGKIGLYQPRHPMAAGLVR